MRAPIEGALIVRQLFGSLLGGPGERYTAAHDGIDYPCLGHAGIDFAAAEGTPVVAMKPGIVRYYAPKGTVPGDPHPDDGYGPLGLHAVVILGSGEQHWYAHLSAVAAEEGAIVGQGARIGRSGNSGNSTGPHLHVAWRPYPVAYSSGFDGFADFLTHFHSEVYPLLDLSGV